MLCKVKGKSNTVDLLRDSFQQFGEGIAKLMKMIYVSIMSDGRARLCALITLLLALVTAVINVCYVSHVNRYDLPIATEKVTSILEREVLILNNGNF